MRLTREDFINQYPPLNLMNKQDVQNIFTKEHINLYIHIPFCESKCDFCYYKSSVPSIDKKEVEDYFLYLLKEIDMYACNPFVKNAHIRSVYVGGGTPTILSELQLKQLMEKLYQYFNITKETEICFESRPGVTHEKEKLALLKTFGIKRLSLGCQSLNNTVLAENGRHHTSEVFYNTYSIARDIGIECINVDLMSGLIGDSLSSWMETLEKIVKLEPENIAIYKLELYYNNKLYQRLRSSKMSLVSDEEEIEWIRKGYQFLLSQGYILADNFSFTKSDATRHIHRKATWEGETMVGMGLSSHSCIRQQRCLYQNSSNMQTYKSEVEKGKLPINRAYKYSVKEQMIQRIIFGIKSLRLDRKKFEDEFGVDPVSLFEDEFALLEQMQFINITPHCVETSLEGAIFADDIVREFYLPIQKELMLGHVERSSVK